jgi:CRISPR-associated Csx3 family protein
MPEKIIIDVKSIFGETAKLVALPEYETKAQKLAREGNEVVLTGAGPVWLYLRIAHALHGKCVTLKYDSPATGEVVIFDHNPH